MVNSRRVFAYVGRTPLNAHYSRRLFTIYHSLLTNPLEERNDVREVVAPEFEALAARGRSLPARVPCERAEVFVDARGQHPRRGVFALLRLVRLVREDARREPRVRGDAHRDAFEFEGAVRDVEGQEPAGRELREVERDGLAREKVRRHCVRAEGVEHYEVVGGRAGLAQAEARVARHNVDRRGGARREVGEERRVARYRDDLRVYLVKRPALARARVGRGRPRAEPDDRDTRRAGARPRVERGEDGAERPLAVVVGERLARVRGVRVLRAVESAAVAEPVDAVRLVRR